MRTRLAIVGTAILTAALTSVFWVWGYSTALKSGESDDRIVSGKKTTPEASGAADEKTGDKVTVGLAGIAVPVAGINPDQLVDTFTQARAGGGRVHDAIDIMAAAGTPVVAASEGVVERLFFSQGGGGITAYIRSKDGRWISYYAHMQGYAPGLVEGQKVERGQIIGHVGSTGNASPAGPHLHFAIHRMGPHEKWWQGTAINPYPLLAG